MALDPLEKELLRRKMALRMGSFLESGTSVSCVSGHVYEEPVPCELCLATHAEELLVIKNRPGRLMKVAPGCLKEMVRFRVTEVDELPRWLEKLTELRAEYARRKAELELQRQADRKRLEKKVIVRKRPTQPA